MKPRCDWFGENRGQCLLKEFHDGTHVCEEDGRIVEAVLKHQVHLSCGGVDPDIIRFSKRDVEAFISLALAVKDMKK